MDESPEARQRRGRRIFVLVAVAFLGPLLVAVGLYFSGGKPGRTMQHGILLEPPGLLPDLTLPAAAGAREPSRLRGKWVLVYAAPGDCAGPCRQALVEMRQVRLALGKEMARVQRVFVADGGMPDMAGIAQEHPGLIVVTAPQDNAAITAALGTRTAGDIFVADPLGNVVLRYPATAGMPDIYKDLQHLLKASGIG